MTRLLALIPGGIGEQLLCFPMLDSLQQHYPEAQIDVVVEPASKAAYRISRVVKQILPYSFSGRTGPADWGNFIGWIREREYDALVSLDNGRFSGLLLWLVGVPKRVSFAGQPCSPFSTTTVLLKPNQYAAQMYHDLLTGLEIHRDCPPLSIQVPRQDLEWAETEKARLGLAPHQGYILIHGGSTVDRAVAGTQDTYPIASWQSLINGLQDRQPDLPIVMVQFPEDRDWVRSILGGTAGLKVSLPEDLGKFAALVAGANRMVSPCAEAMYLAVAVDTPLVVLLGATNPERVLPKTGHITLLRSPTNQIADIAPIQVLENMWGS